MADAYGEIEDAAVRKITGSVDRVGTLIKEYRNDAMPKIAVTVDLLTTGIDVPSIVNLVFLRRVNSRILYEQMLGRATRQCPDIGKETFRIFDAVDLYAKLQNLTEMKPVVVNPTITLEQLFDEFAQVTEDDHRAEIRDQILVNGDTADYRTNPRSIVMEQRRVTAADRLALRIAPGGGAAVRFVSLGR